MGDWIPISERVPGKDTLCLITARNIVPHVLSAKYYVFHCGKEGYWWVDAIRCDIDSKNVIAWMPLPEPYEWSE